MFTFLLHPNRLGNVNLFTNRLPFPFSVGNLGQEGNEGLRIALGVLQTTNGRHFNKIGHFKMFTQNTIVRRIVNKKQERHFRTFECRIYYFTAVIDQDIFRKQQVLDVKVTMVKSDYFFLF